MAFDNIIRSSARPSAPPRPSQSPLRRYPHHSPNLLRRRPDESDSENVIDLGAPRGLWKRCEERARGPGSRYCRPYTPNPRLYRPPSPPPPLRPRRRSEYRGAEKRARRRTRVFRRVVPNPRLYRPAPPRPPPPPLRPRAVWSPPEPPARLDTASHVALRLAARRQSVALPEPPRPAPAHHAPRPRTPVAPPSHRLVVTLPQPRLPVERPPDERPRYHPASEHFRLLSLDTDSGASTPVGGRRPDVAAPLAMDSGKRQRQSASPEDRSEGNESAPSEFLAEFLSAIMRRQYAEALKYCRLILQYEPHNATARGFYPLLQHKIQNKHLEGERQCGSSSEETSAPASDRTPPALVAPPHEQMEQEDDESEASVSEGREAAGASCGSQSSLELDSSEAAVQWSSSVSPSRRTERSERSDSASASAGRWDSSGASRSEDDNGNATATASATAAATADLDNDNASLSSLRRLRAQYTCSIK